MRKTRSEQYSRAAVFGRPPAFAIEVSNDVAFERLSNSRMVEASEHGVRQPATEVLLLVIDAVVAAPAHAGHVHQNRHSAIDHGRIRLHHNASRGFTWAECCWMLIVLESPIAHKPIKRDRIEVRVYGS